VKPEVLYLGDGPECYLAQYAAAFSLQRLRPEALQSLDPDAAARIAALISAAPIDQPTLAALPGLRIIAHPGTGYDSLDVAAARARGILLAYAPGATAGCVADMAFGLLLLAVARDIVPADGFVRAGRWRTEAYPRWTTRLHGRRMGILGLGASARRSPAAPPASTCRWPTTTGVVAASFRSATPRRGWRWPNAPTS